MEPNGLNKWEVLYKVKDKKIRICKEWQEISYAQKWPILSNTPRPIPWDLNNIIVTSHLSNIETMKIPDQEWWQYQCFSNQGQIAVVRVPIIPPNKLSSWIYSSKILKKYTEQRRK